MKILDNFIRLNPFRRFWIEGDVIAAEEPDGVPESLLTIVDVPRGAGPISEEDRKLAIRRRMRGNFSSKYGN